MNREISGQSCGRNHSVDVGFVWDYLEDSDHPLMKWKCWLTDDINCLLRWCGWSCPEKRRNSSCTMLVKKSYGPRFWFTYLSWGPAWAGGKIIKGTSASSILRRYVHISARNTIFLLSPIFRKFGHCMSTIYRKRDFGKSSREKKKRRGKGSAYGWFEFPNEIYLPGTRTSRSNWLFSLFTQVLYSIII